MIVVGSRARLDHPADDYSDLDLVVFSTDVSTHTTSPEWLHEFGEVWLLVLNSTGRGDPELQVVYAGGVKLDIIFVDIATVRGTYLREWLIDPDFSVIFERGVRLLLDKNDPRGALRLTPSQTSPLFHLTADEFTTHVYHFLLHAARAAKFLRRGDRWRARKECDERMKCHLLKILEWHARATKGPDHDTWYDGRFLEEWADPRAIRALPVCFGGYNDDVIWQALFNTMHLFRWLGMETAESLGLTYPGLADQRIQAWIEGISPNQTDPKV